MKKWWVLVGLLVLVGVENGCLIYLGRQLQQVRSELTSVEQEVAQLRVWQSTVRGGPSVQAPFRLADRDSAKGQTLTRFLAQLVILKHERSVGLASDQFAMIQRRLEEYDRRYQALHPQLKQLSALWNDTDAILTRPQKTFLDVHQLEVDHKAEEIREFAKASEESLVQVLGTFVRESRTEPRHNAE